MANPEHVSVLLAGTTAWNKWREDHPEIKPDLSGAKLANHDFASANLWGANLGEADLTGSTLTGINFGGADLSGASLRRTDLRWSNFNNVDVSGTDFSDSVMGECRFGKVDLRNARGLESVKHEQRSTIGTDTIELSDGHMPDEFLAGVGVTSEIIGLAHARAGAIRFHSCFISYSSADERFATQLRNDMVRHHVPCWLACYDMKGGKKLYDQIEAAIHFRERLLVILSGASMSSEWVKTEIVEARRREHKEARQILFPIRIVNFESIREWKAFDADTGKDLARELREYFIPDFTHWTDPDRYNESLAQLLEALRKDIA